MSPSMVVLEGAAGSGGIAIGTLVCLAEAHEVFRLPLEERDIGRELERLEEALAKTRRELGETQSHVREELGDDLAGIFGAHELILADPAFIGEVRDRVAERKVNAEWAVTEVAAELGERFARIESEHLRERGQDLRDVSRYLLRSLQGSAKRDFGEVEGPVILVADELTPGEVLRFGRGATAGIAIAGGGKTSHSTIVAQALRLPFVSGLTGVTGMVRDRVPAIVDGELGRLILDPTPAVLEDARARGAESDRLERQRMEGNRALPTRTVDGVDIVLRANVELVDEIEQTVATGARGIGLYRSEFLYIEKSPELPSEEEQFEVACSMLEAMDPHPVIVRTFDLGGRKLAREVMNSDEENPSLGLRGIRLTLARPEIFRVQVRALMRAAAEGDLRIMVPLVSGLGEIRAFREMCRSVHEELVRENVRHRLDFPVGTMIEVPSAALIADRLAPEVDFMAIGTNDLIQYALAVDRNNEHVAHLYRPLHPAVLEMIHRVVAAGRRGGAEVSVCGEMAADPGMVPILLGLGVRVFSMGPRSIPSVGEVVRKSDLEALESIAERCLGMDGADEISRFLSNVL